MKANAGTLKKGDFIENAGNICQIVKIEHNHQGRGSANYRFKIKSVANGNTVEITCKPDNILEQVIVDSILMQFLYGDKENLTFMNSQTFEQVDVPYEMAADFAQFLKEGQSVYVIFHDGMALAARSPQAVRLMVAEAEDAVKGDTSTSAKKYVTLETGARALVPLFIKKGETIVVNPETGEYVERSN